METPVEPPPIAWQPLTPRGMAAFASAPWSRLLMVQFVIALVAAAAGIWFVNLAWFPVLRDGIRRLPAQGEIRAGTLDWRGASPETLAQGRFLAWTIDLNHAGEARGPADLQIECGRHDVRVYSLLGFHAIRYRVGWVVPFNQPALEPWWGAWAPVLLALAAGAGILGLLLVWTALAALYFVPVWLMGFFGNRDLGWAGSWRVAGAALMPGALFMSGAIVAYGAGALNLVQWLLALAAHWVMGWVCLPLAVWRVPRLPKADTPERNPFQGANSNER